MTDPFDDLERQLRTRVRGAAVSRGARARRWATRRAPLLGVAAALSVSGAALAATSLHHGDSVGFQARDISAKVNAQTRRAAPCQPATPGNPSSGPLTVVPVKPVAAISDPLPWITSPQSRAERAAAERAVRRWQPMPAPVLAGTARVIRTDASHTVVVYVQQGQSWWQPVDAKACNALRQKLAARLLVGREPGVVRAAQERLDLHANESAEIQTLNITYSTKGHRGGSGTALTFDPGSARRWRRVLPHGVILHGGGDYLGIAGSRADHLIVTASKPGIQEQIPRTVRVVENFWTLHLPSQTGAIKVTEVAKDGTVLRVDRLRGPS
jgi:hypothetical protein